MRAKTETFKNIVMQAKNLSQVYQILGKKTIKDFQGIVQKSLCFSLKQGKPDKTVTALKKTLISSNSYDEDFLFDKLIKRVERRLGLSN